jgi:hypothetical protein
MLRDAASICKIRIIIHLFESGKAIGKYIEVWHYPDARKELTQA